MATTYKTLGAKDIVATRQPLHEAIPITGSIVSGTYQEGDTPTNVKNYSHGMFQSVYDYAYLSSSANHIFDITVGYASQSPLSGTADRSMQPKKINLYNQMAQVLVGYDVTGAIHQFDEDGDLSGGTKVQECIFVNFTRLLSKDEIKKGTFSLELGVSGAYGVTSGDPFEGNRIKLADTNAATTFFSNSPAGEYAVLYGTNTAGQQLKDAHTSTSIKAGLLYYQAGVAVITGSVFGTLLSSSVNMNFADEKINAILTGSEISSSCDNIRHRVYDLSFNNTTELNSSIIHCRVNSNDFNYSSNETYLTASKIRVKENSTDPPISYVTTVGLYSPDNELLAVGKLSDPLQKSPTEEFTLRVRLDY
jgi:hypothetical protein